MPVPLEPGEALLGNEPTEDVVNFSLHWKARPLAEVIDSHLDEVVSLPEVVPGDVGGLNGVCNSDSNFLFFWWTIVGFT